MPGQTSGFGSSASADDDLVRGNQDQEFNLKDLRLMPDPPSTYICNICGTQIEKSSATLGATHCGQPMMDVQLRKATDDSVIRKILGSKKK